MKIATTMRYDPDRDVVWIWQDRHVLVPRPTIEALTQSTALSEDDLLVACREREARFADAAARKYEDGELEPDGRVVITSADLD